MSQHRDGNTFLARNSNEPEDVRLQQSDVMEMHEFGQRMVAKLAMVFPAKALRVTIYARADCQRPRTIWLSGNRALLDAV